MISRIAERLGVLVNADLIVNEFNSNRASIGQFNKGERRRFEREMDPNLGKLFVNSFSAYYEMYFSEEIQRMRGIQGSPFR